MLYETLLLCIASYDEIISSIYIPYISVMMKYFATNKYSINNTVAAYLAGFAIGYILWKVLIECYGIFRSLLLNQMMLIVTCICMAYSNSVEIFTFLKFIQGIGAAAGNMIVQTLYANSCNSSEDLVRKLARMNLAATMAETIVPLFANLIGIQAWRYSFIFLACLISSMFFVTLWMFVDKLRDEGSVVIPFSQSLNNVILQYRDAVSCVGVYPLLIIAAFSEGSSTLFFAWMPHLLTRLYDIPDEIISINITSVSLVSTIGMTVVGGLVAYVSLDKLIYRSSIICFTLSIICAFHHLLYSINYFFYIMYLGIFMLLFNIISLASASFTLRLIPQASSAASLLGLAELIGGVFLTYISGIMPVTHLVFICYLMVCSVIILFSLAMFRYYEKSYLTQECK